MSDLTKVYSLDEKTELANPYEITWKEFKSFIEMKLQATREYATKHIISNIAQEVFKKKGRYKYVMHQILFRERIY